jgi:hypothetical protein
MLTSQVPGPIFPSEILLLIGTVLEQEDQKETLSSLARTSRTAWKTLTPLLYRSVTVPFRTSLVGLMDNFSPRSETDTVPGDYELGIPNGLYLLDLIKELTLEAIPKVIKTSNLLPPTSEWHELMILTSHHSFLAAHHAKRLKRLTITGSAIRQLQLADPVTELSSQGYDQVIMPSDGLPPSIGSAEFTFLPQSGFSLGTLIAVYQPLHLLVQYPLTWYQHPRPELEAPNRPVSLDIRRPHESILIDALKGFDGIGATACAHDIHDQIPPNGHIGAQHHISFVAFPSVPICWEPPMSLLPYVSLHYRLVQIKSVIGCSNPTLPTVNSCHGEARRPTSLHQWEASKAGTWTFYRAGAMITDVAPKNEWVHGAGIERRIRAWVRKVFVKKNGHPEGLADDINKCLIFVHGDEAEDPDDLVCEACGHKCTVPVD